MSYEDIRFEDLPEDDDITIKDLYPELNNEQLAEAEYSIKKYLEICTEIYEHYGEEEIKKLLEERKREDE